MKKSDTAVLTQEINPKNTILMDSGMNTGMSFLQPSQDESTPDQFGDEQSKLEENMKKLRKIGARLSEWAKDDGTTGNSDVSFIKSALTPQWYIALEF